MLKHAFRCLALSFLMALCWACNDDDSFTTSPNYVLTFSLDTVKLDTVFSRIPTATRTFWVYNRSGDGVRCPSIRLEKGNQTGFRVNVDGSFLGSSAGYQTSDVEVRNKDSIRVYVELTSPANNKNQPLLLEDNLVFLLESGVEQRVNLRAYTWDADIRDQLVIDRDTTILTEKPLVIGGGILVKENACLTIAAGSTIYFQDNAGIDVFGRLNVAGDVEHNVVLRGYRLDNLFSYLPYDRVSGQWQGIHFHESSYENSINYADIHSAYDGIVCDSASVERLKLNLYNSVVHNCQGYGLLAYHSVVDVVNCQITNTLADCIAVYGGVARLLQSTIVQCYPFDGNRGAALRFANNKDSNIYPLYQFDCVNCLVTGYADDVVMGEADSTATYNFSFENCLLRTPAISDTVRVRNVIWENPEDTVAGGVKHFAKVDTDNFIYDFRLDSLSAAIGKALPIEGLPYDRLGIRRDEEPDLGCYEYVRQ